MVSPRFVDALRLGARAILLAVFFALVAATCIAVTRANGRIASIWLANALLVSALVVRPRREWPTLLVAAGLGNIGADIWAGDLPARALALTQCNMIESLLAAAIIRRGATGPIRLDRREDIARILVAAVVAPIPSATLAVIALSIDGVAPSAALFLNWFAADALGLLILVPLLLSVAESGGPALPRTAQNLLFAAASAGLGLILFSQPLPLLFLVCPLVMLAALRARLESVLVGLAALLAVALGRTVAGVGPIAAAASDPTLRNMLLQAFIAAMTFFVLPLRALVSDRDKLSARAERGEQMFGRIAEASPSGIIYFDPAGKPSFANRRWHDLTGANDPLVSPAQWLRAFHADDRHLVAKLMELLVATHRPQEAEVRFVDEGGDRWALVSLFPEIMEERLLGIVARVSDVSNEVAARAELIEARDAAEEAARAKSSFLATMSHEIRTPLTGVLGMIDLLRAEPEAPERHQYLSTLKQSADLLLAVLDDVLDFSKIDSGAVRLDSGDFDLADLVRQSLSLFTNAASRKGLLLSFENRVPEAAAAVRGDRVRLQQVVVNLLSNAIKFTEQGRVDVLLDLVGDVGAQRFRIEVVDTGIGFSAKKAESLFDPFVQAEGSTSRRFGGTGLGLAIARGLVDAMGGRIGAASSPRRGARFWIELPLPAAEFPLDKQTVNEPVADFGPLDVLIAEDNPVNQLIVSAYMRRRGHRVTCVANGRLAVEAATEARFDVILMDMQMPEMDGLAATRAIRASGGECSDVPIIALTADASPERRRFYEGAGLSAFQTKPIDEARLFAAIAELVGNGTCTNDAGANDDDADTPAQLLDEDRLAELEAVLGEQRVAQLLHLLAEQCRMQPDQLLDFNRGDELTALVAAAHSIKGAAGCVGAHMLALKAEEVEHAPSATLRRKAVRELADVADQTRAAIAARFDAAIRNSA